MMLAGVVAGTFLAAVNARPLFEGGARDWLDVGIVVVWAFVAVSGAAGYVMLGRRIARLDQVRGGSR